MTQKGNLTGGRKRHRLNPANDNGLAATRAEDFAKGANFESPSSAETVSSHLYVEKHEASGEHADMSSNAKTPLVRVFSDIPDQLAVLPEEIATIEPFLADIIEAIIANDN